MSYKNNSHEYYEKYLKYKSKYINLKRSRDSINKSGGGLITAEEQQESGHATQRSTSKTAEIVNILYIFVVFDHGRRNVTHFVTTYHPCMNWVIQQLREATTFGHQPLTTP